MGLEPTALGTTIQCSNQLSYIHHIVSYQDGAKVSIILKNANLNAPFFVFFLLIDRFLAC